MNLDHLAAAPFHLDDEAFVWVRRMFDALTPDERLRQLFVLRGGLDDMAHRALVDFAPGGITAVYDHNHERERRHVDELIAKAKVPPLVSADLEGSRMSLPFGAEVPNPLALAAIDDVEATREVSRIMAEEAVAAGINWSFTPVLDVNHAWRSAIVATRGFGSDTDCIARHALAQIAVFQEHGIAAAVKHWPGEGYDDRDQHLVTTINPLDLAEWERVFGRLYGAAIDAGVLSVMSAHIALPRYVRARLPDAGLEAYRPASVSKMLTTDLLRGHMGFNGLIVSDATPMAGFGAWSPRHEATPDCIAAGCDAILFSDNAPADLGFLKDALGDGRLQQERVDDAVIRILGLKAALGLHRTMRRPAMPDVAANRDVARAITRRAPTLVKDTQNLLPLDTVKHRRVLVITPGIGMPWSPVPLPFKLPELLAARGF
jgi:beta-N-acetylhexosaminidase